MGEHLYLDVESCHAGMEEESMRTRWSFRFLRFLGCCRCSCDGMVNRLLFAIA
jgi:hypothetical protein